MASVGLPSSGRGEQTFVPSSGRGEQTFSVVLASEVGRSLPNTSFESFWGWSNPSRGFQSCGVLEQPLGLVWPVGSD